MRQPRPRPALPSLKFVTRWTVLYDPGDLPKEVVYK